MHRKEGTHRDLELVDLRLYAAPEKRSVSRDEESSVEDSKKKAKPSPKRQVTSPDSDTEWEVEEIVDPVVPLAFRRLDLFCNCDSFAC